MPLMQAVACANVTVDVTLWLAEMLLVNNSSLTQNQTQKERLLKKYRLCSQNNLDSKEVC